MTGGALQAGQVFVGGQNRVAQAVELNAVLAGDEAVAQVAIKEGVFQVITEAQAGIAQPVGAVEAQLRQAL